MPNEYAHVPMPPKLPPSDPTAPPDLQQIVNVPLNLNFTNEFDAGALQPQQRDRLLELLQADRLADKDYLRKHPEVQAFVNLIFRSLVEARPVNIIDHLDEYFQQTRIDLELALQRELDQLGLMRDYSAGSASGSQVAEVTEEEEEEEESRLCEEGKEEEEEEERISRLLLEEEPVTGLYEEEQEILLYDEEEEERDMREPKFWGSFEF